jgi:hypothetical protein
MLPMDYHLEAAPVRVRETQQHLLAVVEHEPKRACDGDGLPVPPAGSGMRDDCDSDRGNHPAGLLHHGVRFTRCLRVAAGQRDNGAVAAAEVDVAVADHPRGVFAPVAVVDGSLIVIDVKAEIVLARVDKAAGAVVGWAEAATTIILRRYDRCEIAGW